MMWNSRSKLAIYPHLAKEALMADHYCIHFCGRQISQDVVPPTQDYSIKHKSRLHFFFKKMQM